MAKKVDQQNTAALPSTGASRGTVDRPLTPTQQKTLASLAARALATASGTSGPSSAPSWRVISDPISPGERFWNHLLGENGVIRGAPVHFLSAVTLVALVLWGLFNWLYGGQYQSQQSQIDLLTLQRDAAWADLATANNKLRELQPDH